MTHKELNDGLIKNANVRRALMYTGAVAGGMMGHKLSPITMGPNYGDDESTRRKAMNELANVAAGAVLGVIAAKGGMFALKRM